ncbi:hypothetical protein AVEN_100692-1 [Araneus ventricosus]|uniref:Uncharacterized protein n=1 Tax=Araneus ventricosus TaxID=182803 RepID=A0A4Y2CSU6_ARAVE|nr:hypothetical protein AVEN_100692-1 [Araneus ventricosus]
MRNVKKVLYCKSHLRQIKCHRFLATFRNPSLEIYPFSVDYAQSGMGNPPLFSSRNISSSRKKKKSMLNQRREFRSKHPGRRIFDTLSFSCYPALQAPLGHWHAETSGEEWYNHAISPNQSNGGSKNMSYWKSNATRQALFFPGLLILLGENK